MGLHFCDKCCTFPTWISPERCVDILAVLPDPLLGRFQMAVATEATVRSVSALGGPGGVAEQLDGTLVHLLVLDPSDRRLASSARTVCSIIEETPWLPCVVYTSLTHGGIKPSVDLLRSGARGLLLAGYDDHPQSIRELVHRLTGDSVAERCLRALDRPLEPLPAGVRSAVRALFGAPHRFETVDDLASVAGISSRHLQRLTTAAGLTRPAQLLAVARVLRAHSLLQPRRMTLESVAARLRVDPRILSRHVRRTLRVRHATELRDLGADELVTSCVRSLYRPPAALPRAAAGASPR